MSSQQEECNEQTPFLSISTSNSNKSIPIYFEQDWDTGIGGGLWSTGLAMAHYIKDLGHAPSTIESILELGSGNGLVSMCWWARLIESSLRELVITDLDDAHLSLIRKTVHANQHLAANANKNTTKVQVQKHEWGVFDEMDGVSYSDGNKPRTFDLIIGSDVAYHPRLYEPLLSSLQHFSHDKTVILLGCTMSDTTPDFFDLLEKKGFLYEKLADHVVPVEYRNLMFGLFCITKKRSIA